MTLQFDESGEPIKPRSSRPRVWSQELQDRLCAALYSLIPIKTACTLVGIDVNTFYLWMQKGEEGLEPYASFAEDAGRALAQAEAALVKKVTDSAMRGNTTDAKWLLSARFKKNWGTRDTAEPNDNPGQPVRVQLVWPGQEPLELPAADVVDAEVVEDGEDSDGRQTA